MGVKKRSLVLKNLIFMIIWRWSPNGHIQKSYNSIQVCPGIMEGARLLCRSWPRARSWSVHAAVLFSSHEERPCEKSPPSEPHHGSEAGRRGMRVYTGDMGLSKETGFLKVSGHNVWLHRSKSDLKTCRYRGMRTSYHLSKNNSTMNVSSLCLQTFLPAFSSELSQAPSYKHRIHGPWQLTQKVTQLKFINSSLTPDSPLLTDLLSEYSQWVARAANSVTACGRGCPWGGAGGVERAEHSEGLRPWYQTVSLWIPTSPYTSWWHWTRYLAPLWLSFFKLWNCKDSNAYLIEFLWG